MGDVGSGQFEDNYQYNLSGQLTRDQQEFIDKIEWTVTGKVKRITFSAAGHSAGKLDLKFIYDPLDRRIAKLEYQTAAPYTWIQYTYYTYDASGNVMAIYEREIQKNKSGNNYTDLFKLNDHLVYVSDRIGTETSKLLLATRTFTLTSGALEDAMAISNIVVTQQSYEFSYRKVGDKSYELANHLGNILAVVTDRNIELGTTNVYAGDVISYSDYSPYGMLLQHRHGEQSGINYRYGYQGSEQDDEIKGEGNSYTTEYRMLDPRVGRWFSTDPVFQPWQSPYTSMDNNPILLNDPLGNVAGDPPKKNVHYYNVRKVNGIDIYDYKYSSTNLILKTRFAFLSTRSGDGSSVLLGVGDYGIQRSTTNVYTRWFSNGTIATQAVYSGGSIEAYGKNIYTNDGLGRFVETADQRMAAQAAWENQSTGTAGWVDFSEIVTVPVAAGVSEGLQTLGLRKEGADNLSGIIVTVGGFAFAKGISSRSSLSSTTALGERFSPILTVSETNSELTAIIPRFSSVSGRWHGPDGRFVSAPTSSEMRSWATSQGWTNTNTTGAGFETWSDASGVKRLKIKPASTQAGLHQNSLRPRATIWNADGQRIDGWGRPVVRRSVTAHAPLAD